MKLRIESKGHGKNTHVFLYDKELKNVQSAAVFFDTGKYVEVVLKLLSQDIEVTVDGTEVVKNEVREIYLEGADDAETG